MSIEQVQWTDQPIPPTTSRVVDGRYRGLRLHVETGSEGYSSWHVSFEFAGCQVVAHGFDRMSLEGAEKAAVEAADRLLAAGVEPRDRLAVGS